MLRRTLRLSLNTRTTFVGMPQQQSIARFFGLRLTSDPEPKKPLQKRSPLPQNVFLTELKHKKVKLEPTAQTATSIEAETAEIASKTTESVTDTNSKPPQSISNDALTSPLTSSLDDSETILTQEAAKLLELTKKEPPILDSAPKTEDNPKKKAKIPYKALCEAFDRVESTSKRLEITAHISQLFVEVLETTEDPKLLTQIVYLCISRLGPDYQQDLELGLGETLLIKTISQCYGRTPVNIKQELLKEGDLGVVALHSRNLQRTMFQPTPLDTAHVFEQLWKIAKTTGKDSQGRKIGTIIKLLTACSPGTSEVKFLIRSLEGKLRIGLAEGTVIVALGQALLLYERRRNGGNKKKDLDPELLAKVEECVKEAFVLQPNYERIITTAYQHGVFQILDHISLQPGIPPKPMLAKPSKLITEVLERFEGEEFTCEYKYDGERAQIHYIDGKLTIFSRNSEDVSERYPDLIGFLALQFKQWGVESIILDSEVVAWDKIKDKILPFQVLSTRKRKGVKEDEITVQICVFAFDVLYFNGKLMLRQLLKERREILFDNLKEIPGKFRYAVHKNLDDVAILQDFLDQSVKDSCEGLMVKVLNGSDSYYEPSKRSRNWLKLKKDYLEGVGDSLDLVVVGAYRGKGKRTGAYGGFLLAVYNQDSGEYETTCKIGTGFLDEQLANLYTKLLPTEIDHPKSFYVYDTSTSSAVPDVWFEPTTVFEVLTADLLLLPTYKALHNEFSKGISLRFPRFLRIRDDKGTEDATLSDQISEFYRRQANIME